MRGGDFKELMCLVVITENEKGLEASVILSSDNRKYDLVSILRVKSYREGVDISNLYNRMVTKKIKVQSLNSIVEAINILGSN